MAPLTEEELLWNEHAKDLASAMINGIVDKLWERQDFQILYSHRISAAQILSRQLRED